MSKVSIRGGFSDRNSIKPENMEMQLKDFDERTRTKFQNMLSELYDYVYDSDLDYWKAHIQAFLKFVLGTVYSEPIDVRIQYKDTPIIKKINDTVKNDEYDDVLTLIEALVRYWDEYLKEMCGHYYYDSYRKKYTDKSIFEKVNAIFEREYVGYRFVDGIIVPISDSFEIETIKSILSTKYGSVREHISKANRLLADRNNPDYENSIKESISAVEAISEIITGTKGKDATLGNMLKKMEDSGIEIHRGLKSAFNILYGYTSDAKGIRHAGDIGGPSSTFEEAKFMLITCCAFINYLIALNSN